MRHEPGEVWFLPPAAEKGGDPKERRHVVLAPCDEVGDVGSFAYASTQGTEARFGAPHLFVDPGSSRSPRTGFSRPSYVYPSRMTLAYSEDLLRKTGQLVDEMPQLRGVLREAVGLGRLRAETAWVPPNWRGRVVRLSTGASESIGYQHGIVVTEPAYSSRERYQLIVPVIEASHLEPERGDLVITEGDWLRSIGSGPSGVLIAIPDTQSIFHPLEIDGWTGTVVDATAMGQIEDALAGFFAL